MFQQKIKTKVKKVITVILTVSLLLSSIPAGCFAAGAAEELVSIVRELTEYRTATSKTYLKSDNTLETVVSAHPLHYKTAENSAWQEYDLTLRSAGSGADKVYQSTAAPFQVNLPQQLKTGTAIEITAGDSSVSLALLHTQGATAKQQKKPKKATARQRKQMQGAEFMADALTLSDGVTYENAYPNTDITYEVNPSGVKESVVLSCAPTTAVSYSYQLQTKNNRPVLNPDGSVDFYPQTNTDDPKPVFHLPAPLMFDAEEEYSYQIETALTKQENDYILTYTPDLAWLTAADRTYPVVVDPSLIFYNGIQDAYTYSASAYQNTYLGYEQQLKVGGSTWQGANDTFEAYLKFKDLPVLPAELYVIDSALLRLTPKEGVGTWQKLEIGAYEITEPWYNHESGTASQRLTYANRPETKQDPAAIAAFSRNMLNAAGGFELKALVEQWQQHPEQNYGIKLSTVQPVENPNDALTFYSSRSSENIPYLSINYSPYVPAESITITGAPQNNRLPIHPNFDEPVGQLNAVVYPENATDKEVVWESSNPEIINIGANGMLCSAAFVEGTVTFTARLLKNPEISQSVTLTVQTLQIESISIAGRPENDELNSGDTLQLSAQIVTENSTDVPYLLEHLRWTSTRPTVASVDETGKVTAHQSGRTQITVNCFGYTASFDLKVDYIPITNVYMIHMDRYGLMYVGETTKTYMHIMPTNATEQQLIYSSSNPEIAAYGEDGFLTALSPGTVTLRATAAADESVFAEFTIEVHPAEEAYVLDLENLPEDDRLALGYEHYFEVKPSLEISDTLAYSSSDPSVLVVDEKRIIAVGVGTATVRVASTACPTIYSEFTVTVKQATDLYTLYTIRLPQNHALMTGGSYHFGVVPILPEGKKDYRILCSDPDVLKIENDTFYPQKAGTATVTIQSVYYPEVVTECTLSVFDRKAVENYYESGVIYAGSTRHIVPDPAISFKLNNPAVAEINEKDGTVTGVQPGTTLIYIYTSDTEDNPITKALVVSPIMTIPLPTVMKAGDLHEGVGVACEPYTVVGKLQWSSSNPDIIEVNDNPIKSVSVHARKPGKATIWAYSPEYLTSASIEITVEPVPVDSITLLGRELLSDGNNLLHVGETGKLRADVKPAQALAFNAVKWYASNNNVKLYENGITVDIEAMKPGATEIWCTSASFESPHYHLVINGSYIVIDNLPDNFRLNSGDTHQLGYDCRPKNLEPVWSSSNTNVLTVSRTGLLTARNGGVAVITLAAKGYSNITPYTYLIEVDCIVNGIKISDTVKSVKVGWSGYLGAIVYPTDAKNRTVSWSSSDPVVATVDKSTGLIHARMAGTTVITAKTAEGGYRASCSLTVDKLLIYQSPNTMQYDENGNFPEDLQTNDISESDLNKVKWINMNDYKNFTPDDFRFRWQAMCEMYCATDPLESVIHDMINHFMNGTGTNYSNDTLTECVLDHSETRQYIQAVSLSLEQLMSEYKGKISPLEYKVATRKFNPMVRKLNDNKVNEPSFDTLQDKINGLTICLDSLWGNQIEIKAFAVNGNAYSGILSFKFYDHFGLNEEDVTKYGNIEGFRAWYILQHNKKFNGSYKPFITEIDFEVPFSGHFS